MSDFDIAQHFHVHSFTDQLLFGIVLVFLISTVGEFVFSLLLNLLPDPFAKNDRPALIPAQTSPAEERSPFPYCPNCLTHTYHAKGSTYETWRQWRCDNCLKKGR